MVCPRSATLGERGIPIALLSLTNTTADKKLSGSRVRAGEAQRCERAPLTVSVCHLIVDLPVDQYARSDPYDPQAY